MVKVRIFLQFAVFCKLFTGNGQKKKPLPTSPFVLPSTRTYEYCGDFFTDGSYEIRGVLLWINDSASPA